MSDLSWQRVDLSEKERRRSGKAVPVPGARGYVTAVTVRGHSGSVPGDGPQDISDGCVPESRQQKESIGCMQDHKNLSG